MDIGSIFLMLALIVVIGIFVSRPLFENRKTASSPALDQMEHKRSTLLAERDRTLNALYELDFDHALGKIPTEDYPQQRAKLLDQGAGILRQLDTLQDAGEESDAHARIDAAIAYRRTSASIPESSSTPPASGPRPTRDEKEPKPVDPNDEMEILLANRRRSRLEKSAGFCPKCGGPLQKSDQFCPKCGAGMA
jgi:hypothetical protein